MKSRAFNILAILLACVIGAISFTLLYLKFLKFDPACTDFFSIYSIVFRALPNLFHTGQVDVPLVLSVLISPVSLLIGLLLKLFDSYLVLILYSAVFSSLTVYFYFLIARNVLKSHGWALLLTFSLSIHPIFDLYSTLGYKPEILGNFAVLAALLAYINKNKKLFSLWLIVAVFAKIEYVPVCLLLGIWFLIFERNKTYGKTAIAVSSFYIVFFLVGFGAIVASKGLPGADTFGGTLEPIVSNFNGNPVSWIFNLMLEIIHPESLKILLLTLPVLILPYFEMPILFLPALVQIIGSLATRKLFVASPVSADLIENSSPFVSFLFDGPRIMVAWLPFIYFAAAGGLKKILGHTKSRFARSIIAASLIIASSFSYYYFIPSFMGPWPFTAYWDSARYKSDRHTELLKSELKKLDVTGLKVALSYPLEIYLEREDVENVAGIPASVGMEFDRILIDLYLCPGFPDRQDVLDWIVKTAKDSHYNVQSFQSGIIVLVRGESTAENLRVVQSIDFNREILNRCFFDSREYEKRIKAR